MKKIVVREDYPVVETGAGKIRGLEIDDVCVFRGIPYAKAERFMAPEAPEPWSGIKECYTWGNACPVGDIMRSNFYCMHRQWELSEDCLNLNVWTSTLDRDAKRPVMVWLHGGGYTGGSSIEEYTMEGDVLAGTDRVVVVSVNHRLNYLGYLDLSGYGPEFKDSANAGMLDIICALQWVRDNIAAFGGDPGNVTLFGQSGGGAKIMTLMQMPAADGLYHKGIIQSGILLENDHLRNGGDYADAIVRELGLDKETIGQIRTIPFAELSAAGMKAAAEKGVFFMELFGPHPDGVSVLDDYECAGFREEVKNVPIMAGSCIGEMSVFSVHGEKQAMFGRNELENFSEE
ncbi:MAG: carboxylesterase/lipase family protein, partial [Lachnospiraceae bacterium]|nr:carboxylesterase/lipase family protein [Lachnospiraceae bacterium]